MDVGHRSRRSRRSPNNLYLIQNQGGNTAVFITANGVVLVDTKNPNNGQAILDQVKTVTDKPVTHIINTHTHADHVGSNAFFPATVEIVTQENTAANMKKMKNFAEETTKQGLPDRTFKDKLTLLSGNESIDLYYFGPRSHQRRHVRRVPQCAGACTPATRSRPRRRGSSTPATAAVASRGARPSARRPRRSRTWISSSQATSPAPTCCSEWQDFVDWGEFNRLYVAHARESLKAGKTPEQAAMDFKLPEKFKDYTLTGGRGGAAGNFGSIFEELKGSEVRTRSSSRTGAKDHPNGPYHRDVSPNRDRIPRRSGRPLQPQRREDERELVDVCPAPAPRSPGSPTGRSRSSPGTAGAPAPLSEASGFGKTSTPQVSEPTSTISCLTSNWPAPRPMPGALARNFALSFIHSDPHPVWNEHDVARADRRASAASARLRRRRRVIS